MFHCPTPQTTADGMYLRSNTAWWALRFSIDTPLPLTPAADEALALTADVLAALPGA